MNVSLATAAPSDAMSIASIRTAVADDLTRKYGDGHWSAAVTEQGVLHGINISTVLVARAASGVVGTLRLATKRPWTLAGEYFVAVARPLYLVDMAVDPRHQRCGIGRLLLEEAKTVARGWPADSIRLDAYDAPAGAGSFYAKCGFREVGRATARGVPLIDFELLF